MRAMMITIAAVVLTAISIYGRRDALFVRGVQNDQPRLMSFALKMGADKNAPVDGAPALFRAAENGRVEIVRRLIAIGGDVNYRQPDTGLTPLMVAAEHGHGEIVDLLLDAHADKEARDSEQLTAYTHAFRASHFDIAHKVQYIAEAPAPEPAATTSAEKPKLIELDLSNPPPAAVPRTTTR